MNAPVNLILHMAHASCQVHRASHCVEAIDPVVASLNESSLERNNGGTITSIPGLAQKPMTNESIRLASQAIYHKFFSSLRTIPLNDAQRRRS